MPQIQITRFFQLINQRQFTQARRQLERIKQKTPRTEWNHGYYKALQGMLLAQKHNDNQYTFFQALDVRDRSALQKHKKEFLAQTQNRFHEDFDKGYFSAWHDYIRLLIKTLKEHMKPQTSSEGQTSIAHYAEAPILPSMEH